MYPAIAELVAIDDQRLNIQSTPAGWRRGNCWYRGPKPTAEKSCDVLNDSRLVGAIDVYWTANVYRLARSAVRRWRVRDSRTHVGRA